MIEVKIEGLDRLRRTVLDPKNVDRAAVRAINDAARSARTAADKAIREKFNLPAARVKKEVRNIHMATRSDLTAIIQAQGRPIGLMNFGARWVRNVNGQSRTTTKTLSMVGKRRSKNTGVTVRILKGKTTRLPSAFVGRARRGNIEGAGALHVFQRTKSGLVNKATITIASMIQQPHVLENMMKKATEVFEKRFWYHFERYTSMK